MKIPKLSDNIKIHPVAWRQIREIQDREVAGRIIQRIAELASDPEPLTEECNSKTVMNLRVKGGRIKRLKCVDILSYRIFYACKKSGMICIYCVIRRDEDTYREDSFHYGLIKLLYTRWRECQ